MKTYTQILPGVKAVYWLDSRHLLPRVDLRAICKMPVPVMTSLLHMAVCNDAQCECKSEREGGSIVQTASLKFLTDREPPEGIALAFVVTDISDKSYLVGSLEHPRAVVNCTKRLGVPDGDAAGYLCEIIHKALRSLIPCTIST